MEGESYLTAKHLQLCQKPCTLIGPIATLSIELLVWFASTLQGFIQDFELGGGGQDGSRMTVACVPTRGVWGHAPSPQEFRSSQIAIRNKIIACDKTIITMLNFKISGGKGGFQGPPPPSV